MTLPPRSLPASLLGLGFLLSLGCGGKIAPDDGDGGLGSDAAIPGAGADSDGGGGGGGSGSGSGSGGGGTGTTTTDGGTTGTGGKGVVCGTATCGASQECCAESPPLTCVAKGSCGGFVLGCTSVATCATGQVCCLTPPDDNGPGGGGGPGEPPISTCKTSCGGGGGGGGGGGIQLCASDAECRRGQRCAGPADGLRTCRGR